MTDTAFYSSSKKATTNHTILLLSCPNDSGLKFIYDTRFRFFFYFFLSFFFLGTRVWAGNFKRIGALRSKRNGRGGSRGQELERVSHLAVVFAPHTPHVPTKQRST